MPAPLLTVGNDGGPTLLEYLGCLVKRPSKYFLQLVSLLAAESMHSRRCLKISLWPHQQHCVKLYSFVYSIALQTDLADVDDRD